MIFKGCMFHLSNDKKFEGPNKSIRVRKQNQFDQLSGTRFRVAALLQGKRVGLRVGRHYGFPGEFPNVRAVYPRGRLSVTFQRRDHKQVTTTKKSEDNINMDTGSVYFNL